MDGSLPPISIDTSVTNDRFYVASRRRRRERFLGLIRQIRFAPGISLEHQVWVFFQLYKSKINPKGTLLKVCNEKFDHSLGEAVVPELVAKKSIPPVLFSSGDRALCSTNIKGHLLYGIDHNLSVCDGRSWLEVTKPNQILRHFEDYDDIYAHSKTFDIESFQIENEGNYFGKRG